MQYLTLDPSNDQGLNLDALRLALISGKYKQAYKVLKSDVGYCCLGLGCKIAFIGKFETSESSLRPGFILRFNGTDYHTMPPAEEFTKFYGIGPAFQSALTVLNDKGGTFEDVALALQMQVIPNFSSVNGEDASKVSRYLATNRTLEGILEL